MRAGVIEVLGGLLVGLLLFGAVLAGAIALRGLGAPRERTVRAEADR